MNEVVASHELEHFRTVIARRLGLQFDDAKLDFLSEVLQRRLEKLKQSSDTYLSILERDSWTGEAGALAQELTVTETYFFRNNEQFRALAEAVLPQRVQSERIPKVLNILSAGCASGEEAYSLAIVARETIADPSWSVSIRAVDINPAALEKARRGRYSAWALRGMSPDVQEKWFRPDGREMILDEGIRAAVKFDAKNLAIDDPELWRPATYDTVFCRNVLMYFSPEQMQAAIRRIARSLVPGGFLFLGHAETLRGLSDQFHLRHTHDTFYYERKGNSEEPGLITPHVFARTIAPAASTALFTEAWSDVIRLASERVAALIPTQASSPTEATPANAEPSPLRSWDLARAFELLHNERFSDALAFVQGLPIDSATDPDVMLLKAMLLTHSGQLAAAEQTCVRLLAVDELNAGAHYVLALCRENSGDRDGAIENDRIAVYLDPAFAMPRLHLGLLARRVGNREAARRELGHAQILLRREDASRLLLFGGGFNREALMTLCDSALRDCGGRP